MSPWLHPDEALGFSTSPWTTSLQALEPRRVKHFTMAALTPYQTYAIHVATLTVASFSILATIVTSFWFFRMRRSFRHDLIMLLIYSDMFKTFWLLVFPAVELVAGKIETDETFCQVSGFFLALSIEASDVSVALISVHTALFIFRGEQGLYPYRKAAYALAAILPVVMASLAFIESPGYINTGQFCYLPFNPMWKRLALSWIPRYLAFAIILFLCIGVYVYVRVLMSRFGAENNTSGNTLSKMSGFESLDPIQQPSATVPPTPTIKYHGLIPSSNASRRNSCTIIEDRPTRPSLATLNSFQMDTSGSAYTSKLHSARTARRGSAQMWMSNFGTDLTAQEEQVEVDSQNSTGTTRCGSDDVIAPLATYTKPEFQQQTHDPAPTRPAGMMRNASYLSTTGTSRTPNIPNLFTILNRKTERPQSAENNLVLTQSDINAPGTVKTREKILRQLRLLFIYPIVYVVIWILPFIVQLTGYGKGAPYGMRLASIVFLCLHGLADSLVFCLKEKPWRHSQTFNQTFKRFNLQFWKRRQEAPDVGARVGRTREEMTLDSRFAKARREQEQAEWEMERQAGQDARKAARAAPDWWDRDD
ncbi:G protein-coupled receptor gpr1 [Fusarium irregulare]|uniref:G protein-coupled receptor gpr1 n=1 Tax=Fusarium irregulare TaxID=2494466 RepID=A0A9W8U9C6_9HYPO|nr:G protein-coupled receptor gpr1 [Fusarium irregulare]KAJ4021366.1 G protein-coupled receptor gpr1 [Fusarium irregulare]